MPLYRVYFVLIAFVSCLERQKWRYIRNNFLNSLDVYNMVECVGVLLENGGGGGGGGVEEVESYLRGGELLHPCFSPPANLENSLFPWFLQKIIQKK